MPAICSGCGGELEGATSGGGRVVGELCADCASGSDAPASFDTNHVLRIVDGVDTVQERDFGEIPARGGTAKVSEESSPGSESDSTVVAELDESNSDDGDLPNENEEEAKTTSGDQEESRGRKGRVVSTRRDRVKRDKQTTRRRSATSTTGRSRRTGRAEALSPDDLAESTSRWKNKSFLLPFILLVVVPVAGLGGVLLVVFGVVPNPLAEEEIEEVVDTTDYPHM